MAQFCSTSALAPCRRTSRASLRSMRSWKVRPSLGQIARPEGTCWTSLTAAEQVLSKCFLSISIVAKGLAWRAGWTLGRRRKMRGGFSGRGDLYGALGCLGCVLLVLGEVLVALA